MTSRHVRMTVDKNFKEQVDRLSRNFEKKHNLKLSKVEITKVSANILRQIDSETFAMRRTKRKGSFR